MSKCIEWTKGKRRGYGIKYLSSIEQQKYGQKTMQAHRYTWIQHYGDIPKELLVLHKCHNRACINPKHLHIGTMVENRQDDIKAGKDWWLDNLAKGRL